MLDTAAGLFGKQGYHATGLNQLTAEGGAPKGSLYFHFPGGKEQLAAEALAASSEGIREELAAAFDTAETPADAVDTVIGLFARNLTDSDFREGCPLTNVALDAAAGSEPIRRACVEGFGSWEDVIATSLAAHGIHSPTLPTAILATVEGALMLAKTRRDTAPLYAVARHLRATVETELS